ncbi:hypothetical protein [Octadecabacter sp. R77987]|uniref:hypothetical protein n=1 Tax=Octadecabacter sp. R77987 TaxID=3093874 RepID=UPI00366F39F7
MIAAYFEAKAARVLDWAAYGGAGTLLVLSGVGLLATAGLIVLSELVGWPLALTIVGTSLSGAGLVMVGLSRSADPKPAPRRPEAEAEGAAMVQAFLQGVQTGTAAKAAR